MSFDHLKKYAPKVRAADYVMDQLEEAPTFHVLPALEENKPYYREVLKLNAKQAARMRRGVQITPQLLEQSREQDRRLFAEHIVQGWDGVVDGSGTPVPFSKEKCREFFAVLPSFIFDDLRTFCGDVTNFVDGPSTDEIRETAGN